ncbi:hypothetical protein GCM10007094_39100 [Pseudovibrio japonicus]|uniref:Transposase n=1 Tax=Pseudovibrio japonicus TaxID=366534 RepID=A0ABQ3ER73_9HYPH|nr:transposase [Pseudovibrio japonicus]GHB45976.1 hypothetical protein GCM10007094_39100 [Pseudovibrio japonicus]
MPGAYTGFNGSLGEDKVTEIGCPAHISCKFIDIHAPQGSSIVDVAIQRISTLNEIEKQVCSKPPPERVKLWQMQAKPAFDDREDWLHSQLDNRHLDAGQQLSRTRNDTCRFGTKELSLQGITRGGRKTATTANTLIQNVKLNNVNPQAWLTLVLDQTADQKLNHTSDLMP